MINKLETYEPVHSVMNLSKTKTQLIGTIIIFLFTGIMYACSSTPKKQPRTAQGLLQKGIKEIKLNSHLQAKATFNQILEDFPDSKERVQALLLLARTFFIYDEFEEAKFHFENFISLYPTHKQADRAYFFKAMTDFHMIDIASRDQTSTRDALDGFTQLISRFPNSQFLKKAKRKKKECELKLAQNVLEIGKFYYRTGSYQSAINRLKRLMVDYPKQKFFDEAIFFIAESYYQEQNFNAASASYKELLKKYPRSQFKLQARNRLRTLPREPSL